MLFLTFISYFFLSQCAAVILGEQWAPLISLRRISLNSRQLGCTFVPNGKNRQKLKSWKLTNHTNACNSLASFKGEAHPLTGNGNADICLESPNWSEYNSVQVFVSWNHCGTARTMKTGDGRRRCRRRRWICCSMSVCLSVPNNRSAAKK